MRTTSRCLASLLGLVLGASLMPAAAAAPAGTSPKASPLDPVSVATVTLITGDVVRLSTFRGGRQSVEIQPGTPSGRFQTVQRDGHAFVIPDAVQPYVRDGLLDERLFDVTALVTQRYDDRRAPSLPLILEYATDPANVAGTRSLLARPVPAEARRMRNLPSVGSVAVGVPRGRLSRFWEAVDDDRTGGAARRLDQRIRKIWLDSRVSASLDVSVGKIGAPAAWQAGFDGKGVKVAVLDTGVDASHPDLAGRVVESVNFGPSADANDRHGHGTHVASTVAGTGAASAGKYRGVAPGADLLNVKVLGDDGSGPTSGVIAGMEWAASRAKVVSLSLGDAPTDGTDPASQAVNRLSAAHGTLFVIAAGNSGPAAGTVASPAAADAALTVGAATKTDVMASFSSRGPRLGDRSVKPEIVAPGVSIVAARAGAAGPDGSRYVGASGTSMATPHVSGAAALLAQQHPDWTGQQLKALLTSTASPLAAGTVYDQGAGRVDLTRAVAQRVTASTGVLSMGRFVGPYGNVDPVRKTVTYRNDGDADVTLDLALTAKSDSGAVAGPEMLDVSPASVTVPAGGTATATVTVDPDTGELGLYSGRLTATGRDGRTVLATAVGYEKELLHTLTVKPIARDGKPAGRARVMIWNLDTGAYRSLYLTGEPLKVELRSGEYSVFGFVSTMDEPGVTETEVTAIAKPQLAVSRDADLVLDARGAKPVNVRTPKPAEKFTAGHQLNRSSGGRSLTVGVGAWDELFVVPSEPAHRGALEYLARLDLQAPLLTMRIAGPGTVLHPEDLTPEWRVTKRLDGRRRLPAVFVGAGRPDDYAGRDVRGKVVLVRHTAGLTMEDQVAAAAAAKAALVMVLASGPGVFDPYVNENVPLPTYGLSQAEGAELLRRLSQGPVTLDLHGTPYSPYRYLVALPFPQVPDGVNHVIDRSNTALRRTNVHAVRQDQVGHYADTVWRPYMLVAFALIYQRPFPFRQDRYFTANDTEYGQSLYASTPASDLMVGPYDTFKPGEESTRSWFKGPIGPGTSTVRYPTSRNGDQLLLTLDSLVDAEPDHINGQQGAKTAARVYRDGRLVAEGRYGVGYFDVGTAEPATYRVELDMTEGRPGWRLSPEAYAALTFRSARPAAPGWTPLPVITARWDLDLDLDNAAPAGGPFTLRLNAATQPGATPVAIRTAKAWVSFDDGGTWRRVPLAGAEGRFAGVAQHPRLRDTTGFASLRYEITDAAGGKLEHTVLRAYALN